MRKALCRLAFAILKRQKAKLWWNTADVPGLFDPMWKGRMVFDFETMRFRPPEIVVQRLGDDETTFNFVHTCPPSCEG